MQVLNIKIEESILKEIDKTLKKHRYSTRTEFVREALREKMSKLEMQELFKGLEEFRRHNKRKTTDADLHRVRGELAKELEKEFR